MILLAALPLVVVLALMAGARWSGPRAALVGWLSALAIATGPYATGAADLLDAQLRGVFASLEVLAIIWSAFGLSHVIAEAGALGTLTQLVARLTADATLQLLVLAWVFAALVQGVTGFGVPIAVVAPLLLALGFPVLESVVATAVGHAWAVTFGSLGSSIAAMAGVTGLPASQLAPASAIMLGAVCLACGLAVAYVHDGWPAVRRSAPAVGLVGGVMAGAQWLVARLALWNLAAFAAALSGLMAAWLVARWPRYRGSARPAAIAPGDGLPLHWALAGYWLLLGFALAARFIRPIAGLLGSIQLDLPPAIFSSGGGPVMSTLSPARYSLFGSSGALIGYSAAAAYVVYRSLGCYRRGSLSRIAGATWRSASRPTLAILLLMGLAMTMAQSGMTDRLANGLSDLVGGALPLVAPFTGALGAFMTGSNTHSNVVFGLLQQSMARHLGYDIRWILAAQNAGGAVGSVFSPAKVAVACGVLGLAGQEAVVLRRTLAAAMPALLLAALLAFVLTAPPVGR